jgi:signal transduction histidine kinase
MSDPTKAGTEPGGEAARQHRPAGRVRSKSRLLEGKIARHALAVIAVLIAYLIRALLMRKNSSFPPYFTFYPAILLVALLGDLWAGLVATLLSAAAVVLWILPGVLTLRDPIEAIGLSLFFGLSIAICVMTELSHRNREKLAAYQLEEAVRNERSKLEEAKRVVEMAHAERQRLFNLLDSLPAMISLLSPDHQVVFANRAFRTDFGLPDARHCYEVQFGRSAPCEHCENFEVLKTGKPHHWEHLGPDGHLVETYDTLFPDLDGSPLVLSMNFDITQRRKDEIELREYRERLEALVNERTTQLEASNARLLADIAQRKKAEEALRESERRYSALFANKINAMVHCRIVTDEQGSPVDYRVLKVNQAFEEILKVRREKIEGHTVNEFSRGGGNFGFDHIGLFGKIALEGGELKVEAAYVQATGQYLSIYAYSAIPGEFTAMFTDVTQIKKGEDTKRALMARLQKVREEERTTVARELHDQLGQILTAIKMDMTWVARRLPKENVEVRERLEQTIHLINDGAQTVRKICSGLRPRLLDDIGLAAAIEWQANEFSARTGIRCKTSVPAEDVELDSDCVTAIFRVFQEALTNVTRHAEAHQVMAKLSRHAGSIQLVVEDDGKGFCEAETGNSLGLLGMRERAEACGGHLTIATAPSQGTAVTMRIPLSRHGAARVSPR